jgi:hypothetical protein
MGRLQHYCRPPASRVTVVTDQRQTMKYMPFHTLHTLPSRQVNLENSLRLFFAFPRSNATHCREAYHFFSRSSPSFKPALNLLAYQWFFTAVASNSHGLNQHASVFCFVYYPRPLLIYLLFALLLPFALSTTFLCSMCVDPRTHMYHEDGRMKQSIPPAPHQEDGSPTISLL